MCSGFELQPLDGGPRVPLAPGQTVIGRGPLLGITDKRVSRRHAILEVLGSQLRIKPIHTSPCFYQSSGKNHPSPMKTHLWCWLHPGDSFSLLVNKYIFRVFSAQSEMEMECTLRNSQILDEEDILNDTPKSPIPNLPDKTIGSSQLQKSQELTKIESPTRDSMSFLGECGDFSKQQSNPAQRKRILPAWMLAENLSDQKHSISISGDNNVIQRCGKEGICKDKTPVNITWQGRKRLTSSGNSESVSAEQEAGKKCKNYDKKGPVVSFKKVPESSPSVMLSDTDTKSNRVPIEELGKGSEQKIISNTTNTESKTVHCSESPSDVPITSFSETSQGSHPECGSDPSSSDILHTNTTDLILGGSAENKTKRMSCIYGANCYRKNPLHFQHFSHPGDSNFGHVQVTDETMTDDRPECPYGASCYRKNPQHKIEYRHSILPVEEDSDEVGQPRENDLNDSFLDDEEEDEPTDEDSDWQPGKEDEDEEDVEELLKEAKKFMKRKK